MTDLTNRSGQERPTESTGAGASKPLSRRALVRTAGAVAGAVVGAPVLRALAQTSRDVPAISLKTAIAPLDATKVPGLPSGALGARSPFENPGLAPVGVTTGPSFTPLQDLTGTITPSDLHFQRHHNGIALIDPAKYSLTIHGLVERAVSFSLDDLK